MKKAFNLALFNHPTLLYTDKAFQSQLSKLKAMSYDLHKSKHLITSYTKLKGSLSSTIIPLSLTSEDSIYHSNSLLIIADGVGGWKELGIDSSVYSRTLCERIASGVNTIGSISTKESFKEIIVKAINTMSSDGILGSSTFCAVYLNYRLSKAFIVSMGDTLVMIMRLDQSTSNGNGNGFRPVLKTVEQQHSFNMPYQCGHVGDSPDEALMYAIDIEKGDVIVIASDGLWDNVNEKEIIDRVNREEDKEDIGLVGVVNNMALLAKQNSIRNDIQSPFAVNAMKNNLNYYGGKPDDISMIVMQIKEDKEEDEDDRKSHHSKISGDSKGSTTTIATNDGLEDCEEGI